MPDQPTLFDAPPPRVRPTDPETSRWAAARAASLTTRALVLRILAEHGPLTDEALVQWAHLRKMAASPSGIRSRRAELVQDLRVRFTGRFQNVGSGNPARVWEITPAGKLELRQLEKAG